MMSALNGRPGTRSSQAPAGEAGISSPRSFSRVAADGIASCFTGGILTTVLRSPRRSTRCGGHPDPQPLAPALADGVHVAGGRLRRRVGVAFRHCSATNRPTVSSTTALRRWRSGLADVAQQMLTAGAVGPCASDGEGMLRRTIDQVGHYFGDDGVRAMVRARWRAAVASDRVLVAHSLGSRCVRLPVRPPGVADPRRCDDPIPSATRLVLAKLEVEPCWPGSIRRWVGITRRRPVCGCSPQPTTPASGLRRRQRHRGTTSPTVRVSPVRSLRRPRLLTSGCAFDFALGRNESASSIRVRTPNPVPPA
jgi:hypothetical protein